MKAKRANSRLPCQGNLPYIKLPVLLRWFWWVEWRSGCVLFGLFTGFYPFFLLHVVQAVLEDAFGGALEADPKGYLLGRDS